MNQISVALSDDDLRKLDEIVGVTEEPSPATRSSTIAWLIGHAHYDLPGGEGDKQQAIESELQDLLGDEQ